MIKISSSTYIYKDIGTPSDTFRLRINITFRQNVQDRSTFLDLVCLCKRLKSSVYPYNSNGYVKLTIGSRSWDSNIKYNLNDNEYHQVYSASNIKITHNSDGTKSVPISFYIDGKLSNWYPKGTISRTITLPNIPVASTITTNKSLFAVGDTVKVSIQKHPSSTNYKVKHHVYLSTSEKSIAHKDLTTLSTSFVIPDSWDSIVSSSGTSATIKCVTVVDSTTFTTKKTITIKKKTVTPPPPSKPDPETKPPSGIPVDPDENVDIPEPDPIEPPESYVEPPLLLGAYIIPDDDSEQIYRDFGNKFVEGKTKAVIRAGFQTYDNKSKKIYIKNTRTDKNILAQTLSPYESDYASFYVNPKLNSLSNLAAHCYDSSGNHTNLCYIPSEEVLSYSPPQILDFQSYRADLDGTPNDKSDNVRISFKYQVDSMDGYHPRSSINYYIEYTTYGSETWHRITGIPSINDYSGYVSFNGRDLDLILRPEESYQFKVTLNDYFTTVTNLNSSTTEDVIMEFNKSGKGMSIGKPSDYPEALEIAMPILLSTPEKNNHLISLTGANNINLLDFKDSTLILGDYNSSCRINSSRIDFNNCDVLNFKMPDLTGTTINGATLDGCVISNSMLENLEIDLTNKRLDYPTIYDGTLYNSLFEGGELQDVTFSNGSINWNAVNKPPISEYDLPQNPHFDTLSVGSHTNKIVVSPASITTDEDQIRIYTNLGRLVIGKSIGHNGTYTRHPDTSSTLPVKVDSTGVYCVTSSSKRYKHDIVPLRELLTIQDKYINNDDRELFSTLQNNNDNVTIRPPILNYKNLLNLEVCQFKYNKDYFSPDKQDCPYALSEHISLIAEDVEKYVPEAAVYLDGKVHAWDSEPILLGLLMLVQDQQKELELLNKRVKLLESTLTK